MKLNGWLSFFRLPNLPTAPGDALAGAAVALAIGVSCGFIESGEAGTGTSAALCASAAALFVYMFGLADNDIFGYARDRTEAPHRPLVTGEISFRAANIARFACLFLAAACGAAAALPPAWWFIFLTLTVCIVLYNRFKDRCAVWGFLSMGLCRGLSVLAGAAAVDRVVPAAFYSPVLLSCAAGWFLYISALTYIAANEHDVSTPMPKYRYALGASAFIPLAAFFFLDTSRISILLPSVCCAFAFTLWVLALSAPGINDNAAVRRAATGRMIKALLYIQSGFILVFPHPDFVIVIAFLFLISVAIRKIKPDVLGS